MTNTLLTPMKTPKSTDLLDEVLLQTGEDDDTDGHAGGGQSGGETSLAVKVLIDERDIRQVHQSAAKP